MRGLLFQLTENRQSSGACGGIETDSVFYQRGPGAKNSQMVRVSTRKNVILMPLTPFLLLLKLCTKFYKTNFQMLR